MKNCLMVAGCLAGFVIVLFAADEHRPLNVKPGTWQIEYKINYSGLPPQYQSMMDQMTDQQKSAMGLATRNFDNLRQAERPGETLDK